MKIYNMVFSCLLLFIAKESLSHEAYDFSPLESSDYNDSEGYYDLNQTGTQDYATNDYERYRYRKYSENYSSWGQTKHSHRYAGAGKAFIFDPKQLRWYAFYNGNLVSSGRASGGRYYCSDIHRPCKTPVGTFHIGYKGGSDCKSSKYPIGRGNAPMPWCMFFFRGFAIHGGPVPPYNASHGCIRVERSDARWLNRNFLNAGTKVIVKSYH
jgi:L,D-transpeptidase catalytic domain